eukprot:jgi/Botrbrau1/10834/Bobra.0025s0013.1
MVDQHGFCHKNTSQYFFNNIFSHRNIPAPQGRTYRRQNPKNNGANYWAPPPAVYLISF